MFCSCYSTFLFKRALLATTTLKSVFLTWAAVLIWDSSTTVPDTPCSPHPAAACPGYAQTHRHWDVTFGEVRAAGQNSHVPHVSYQRPSKLTHCSRALTSSSVVPERTQWDSLERRRGVRSLKNISDTWGSCIVPQKDIVIDSYVSDRSRRNSLDINGAVVSEITWPDRLRVEKKDKLTDSRNCWNILVSNHPGPPRTAKKKTKKQNKSIMNA